MYEESDDVIQTHLIHMNKWYVAEIETGNCNHVQA